MSASSIAASFRTRPGPSPPTCWWPTPWSEQARGPAQRSRPLRDRTGSWWQPGLYWALPDGTAFLHELSGEDACAWPGGWLHVGKG
jgi:hypothetical protein